MGIRQGEDVNSLMSEQECALRTCYNVRNCYNDTKVSVKGLSWPNVEDFEPQKQK